MLAPTVGLIVFTEASVNQFDEFKSMIAVHPMYEAQFNNIARHDQRGINILSKKSSKIIMDNVFMDIEYDILFVRILFENIHINLGCVYVPSAFRFKKDRFDHLLGKVREHLKKFDEKTPLIIVGDFNSSFFL